ncbi:hypothetical protein PAHAL_6G199300 [Panicum hallii]|uniref:DUF1618 domain-containing protein n=1 Tax=Panicum hallii TaxID=206008 RepID=A0A2S3I2G3_9POAL|nr:uncharacterized protein LOC112898270 [Panicum hallii]PAN35321.1 hypothetical protein PAHAL_6G199300 [Panicum hallii]
MASEAAEPSRAREEAAEREASEAVARQPQRSWVALASIPVVVYGANDARAEAIAPGAADLLLELHDPPRASYLVLPERLVPDPRWREPNNFAYIIAAARDRLLFMASQRATQGRGVLDPDYFLCNVSDGTAARLPAVPADFRIMLFPRRTMGLIADPRCPGHYMIAQLHPDDEAAMKRHDALLCYSTATGQWSVKQLASAPDHEPWGAHGVIAHGGLLWWVDIAYGMLFCDPFDDHPRLRLVPLPTGCEMHGLGNNVRPTILMDQRRLIRPSQGMLRYVEIQGLSYDHADVDDPISPAVTMWTLVDPEGPHPWRFECEASFDDIWAHDSYVAAGLPQGKVPKLALVDPNNHDVVYFFQDTALFALDVRARRVLACEECFVDRVFQDPLFQYSRFIDAWERELPPTVRGDGRASSDGGSGTKGPGHEEESDAGTGSDEEMASLLSQLEVIRSRATRPEAFVD